MRKLFDLFASLVVKEFQGTPNVIDLHASIFGIIPRRETTDEILKEKMG
jgi:hypothetical protein